MDLATLRDRVRLTLDTDTEDLPNELLDLYLAEGFQRIVDSDERWPWLEKVWEYQWPANTASVDLAEIGTDIESIASVQVSGDRVLYAQGHDAMERYWATDSFASGTPEQWSAYGSKLYLWPTPTTATSLVVRGQRTPVPFAAPGDATGSEPDCPEPFHRLVMLWALHSAYERDEDTEMSAYYRSHFEDGVAQRRKALRSAPPAAPLVMGGGLRTRGRGVSRGPRFPFEF